eukprot:4939007-Amphidinium_carterae.1
MREAMTYAMLLVHIATEPPISLATQHNEERMLEMKSWVVTTVHGKLKYTYVPAIKAERDDDIANAVSRLLDTGCD